MTFVDAVTARRIDVEVDAPDIVTARERGWAALRATRPSGLVVVELAETRPADDNIAGSRAKADDGKENLK